MTEKEFRARMFYLLLGIKLFTLLVIFFEWWTFAYSTEEVLKIVPIIFPLLAIYTSVLYKEIYADRFTSPQKQETVNKPLLKNSFIRLQYFILFL